MDRGNRRGGRGQGNRGRQDRQGWIPFTRNRAFTSTNPPTTLGRDRSRSPFRGGRQENRRRSPLPRSRSPPRGPRGNDTRRQSNDYPPQGARNQPRGRPTQGREIKTEEDKLIEKPISNGNAHPTSNNAETKDVKMEIPEDETEEEMMMRLMGFNSFKSTKNTKVPGNDKNYGVYKVKQTEYRQYMNRVGGFNRPLSPTRR